MKVLGITNDFRYSSNNKIYGKEPRQYETSLYSEQILPVSWSFAMPRFPCTSRFTSKLLLLPAFLVVVQLFKTLMNGFAFYNTIQYNKSLL